MKVATRAFIVGTLFSWVMTFLPLSSAACHSGGDPSDGAKWTGGYTNKPVDGLTGNVTVQDGTGMNDFTLTFDASTGTYSGTLSVAYSSNPPENAYLVAKVVDSHGNSASAGSSTTATTVNVSVTNPSLNGALNGSDDWFLEIHLIIPPPPSAKDILLLRMQIHDG